MKLKLWIAATVVITGLGMGGMWWEQESTQTRTRRTGEVLTELQDANRCALLGRDYAAAAGASPADAVDYHLATERLARAERDAAELGLAGEDVSRAKQAGFAEAQEARRKRALARRGL